MQVTKEKRPQLKELIATASLKMLEENPSLRPMRSIVSNIIQSSLRNKSDREILDALKEIRDTIDAILREYSS